MPTGSVPAGVMSAAVASTAVASATALSGIDSSSINDASTRSGTSGGETRRSEVSAVFVAIATADLAALPQILGSYSADLDRLLTSPPAAADISRLWTLLDSTRQDALVRFAPHVVGNLEGVPYDIRNRANRLDLERTISAAKEHLQSERGKAERIVLKRRLATLGNVETALKKKDGVARTLVSLVVSQEVKAAIVVGDLQTARYVSVLVPGMYMSVGEQLEAWAGAAQELYDQQTGFLTRFLGSRPNTGRPGVAVVAWIGYQTPVLMNIGGLDLARQGADSVERTLDGITSVRAANPPYLSLLAHSYGSTVALLALERGGVEVDALALLGSPGSEAQSVSRLSVRNGNVFVGEAPMDPIVNSAFFGSDPGAPSYGAKLMGVDGAVDPITHRTLTGSSGHNEYFTVGTECMRNLAMIAIDKGDLVLGVRGSGAAHTAQGVSSH